MTNRNRKNEEDMFEFVWKIENFDACPKKSESKLPSPTFVAENLNGTSWYMWVTIRSENHEDCIGLYLHRARNCCSDDDVNVELEISILKAGTFHYKYVVERRNYGRYAKFGYGARKIVELSKLLEQKNIFLPNNVLTLRCLVRLTQESGSNLGVSTAKAACRSIYGEDFEDWHSELTPETVIHSGIEKLKKQLNPAVNSCIAVSRIGVERVSIELSCEKLSDWKTGQEHAFPVKSASQRSQYLMFTLSLGEVENVLLKIYKKKHSLEKFSSFSCKVSIPGVVGELGKVAQREFCLEKNQEQTFTLESKIVRSELMVESRLRLEFSFSEGKIVASRIVESFAFPPGEAPVFSAEAETPDQENLRKVFLDQKYCDVTFRIGDEEIPAHRSIVASRSPVLDRMFSTEMKEKDARVVQVDGVDAQTFKRMLMFMYSQTVADDMSDEEAANLYVASDKYEFVALMKKCTLFLARNLDIDNACAILSLADDHSDGLLKSSAIKYMCKHANTILCSDEWKALAENKFLLASEALQKISLGLIQ